MLNAILPILLASAGLIEARSVFYEQLAHMHRRRADDATGTTLSPAAIQSGSFNDGSDEIGSNEAQQAKSLTSQNNFINNCAGKTLTNGLQITTGSCNGITMGDIPAKTNMVSSIITFPLYGSATIESDTTFNISVQMSNLVAGSFTNADATYYAAPQQLSGGIVVGHTHVTVQDMGKSLNPTEALDPTQFAFFKGINDAGNGKGLLQATVTGGLPAGNYRVCTLASASNHQPVLMPVAQRGTPDDCTKFTVIGSGTTINAAANDGSKGDAAAALAASAVAAGPDVAESSAASSTVASSTSDSSSVKDLKSTKGTSGASETTAPFSNSTAKATGKSGNKGGKGGKGGKGSTTTSLADIVSTASSSSAETTTSKALSGGKNGGGKAVLSESKAAGATTTTSSVASASGSSSKKGSGKGKSGGSSKTVVTVIETFFEFSSSLGGLCPSVGKSDNGFQVLEEIFDDLASAAAASCGHQFDACVGIEGPGFSIEECTSQKDSCGSAASTASASATPAKITATVSVPVTVTVTGSILSSTVVSAAGASSAIAISSAAGELAVAQTTAPAALAGAASSSTPCISTQTITVDPPAVTQVLTSSSTESDCTISTGTVFVDAPSATIISSALFSNGTATKI